MWNTFAYALLRSIDTVPTTLSVSKHFCQFFNKFKRAFCNECSFLNPHRFGENILLVTVSSCEQRTFLNILEIIDNKLVGR